MSDALGSQVFDLVVVSRQEHLARGLELIESKSWLVLSDEHLAVGPTISDVDLVATTVRSLRPDARVAAFGGARVLGSTVVGCYLTTQRDCAAGGQDGVRAWLQEATSNGSCNFWRHPTGPNRPQVDVIPASLLAVQAVIAKTWIVNDPGESTTYWGSADALVPRAYFVLRDYLMESFRARQLSFDHDLAVVVSVFVECIAYKDTEQVELALAQDGLSKLAAAICSGLTGPLSDGFVETCIEAAIQSRTAENVVGPAMPALALSQAIARVCARKGIRVAGSEVIGRILPHMLACMKSRGQLRIGREQVRKWSTVCHKLQGLWPTELWADKHDDEIAARAAAQTLSRKARLNAADHKRVLADVRSEFEDWFCGFSVSP